MIEIFRVCRDNKDGKYFIPISDLDGLISEDMGDKIAAVQLTIGYGTTAQVQLNLSRVEIRDLGVGKSG